MNEAFFVNGTLAIELLPSINEDGQPALCLRTRNEPQQSIRVSLSEVYVLRDVLAQAGAQLALIESRTRQQRKATVPAN